MKDIDLLKGEIREKTLSAQDIINADSPTKEDLAKYDEVMAEVRSLKEKLENQEAIEKRRLELDAEVAKLEKKEERKTQAQPLEVDGKAKVEVRGKKSSYFDSSYAAYECGQWLAAQVLNDQKAQRWINTHTNYEIRAQSVGTDSSLVPTPLSSTIINLRDEFGTFPRYAQRYTMTSNTLDVPKRGQKSSAYWVDEATNVTESSTRWSQVSLTAKKIGAYSVLSREISEDAVIDLADFVARDIAMQLAEEIDTQGWMGTGSPFTGLVTAIEANAALGAHVTIDTVDQFSEVTATHLTTLMANLPSYARRGAAWYVSPEGASLIFDRLKISGGGHTSTTLSGATGENFMGFPVRVIESFPSSTGSLDNEVLCVFGRVDMSSIYAERSGLEIIVDPYTLSQSGQVQMTALQRVSMAPAHSLGTTHEDSPVVALVGKLT